MLLRKPIFILYLCLFSVSAFAQGKIIYAFNPGGINNGGTLDLKIYDTVTRETEILLKGSVVRRGEYNPALSPDGSNIIFNTYRFSGWKLGIADYQNGELSNIRRLTDRRNYEYNATYSPDGTKIAYQEYNWSTRDTDIFIADQNGKNAVHFINSIGSDNTPDWSWDNKSIVFASERSGNSEIYLKSLSDNTVRSLTHHDAIDFAPASSKKDGIIAFLSDRDGQVNLYTVDLQGNNLTNLTATFNSDDIRGASFDDKNYWAYKTSWSPDGNKIVFTLMYDGDLELFTVNKDGTALTQITDNNDTDMTPFWTNE